jgi:hypothetical protein
LFLVFQLHHHGGHSLHSSLLSPSDHERETEGEATSRCRVGRSRCAGSRTATTAGVTTPQRQHSASTAATPPPAAATKATLVATHELLNNSPLPHTSPSVVEQWCHNIDQLIVATTNTLPQEGWHPPSAAHLCTPTMAHTPSAPRMPSVVHEPLAAHVPSDANAPVPPHVPAASITTADLRTELNHRRNGEDSCITIEH